MITNYNTYLKENTDNIDYLKILNDVVDNLNSEFTTPEFNVVKSVNNIADYYIISRNLTSNIVLDISTDRYISLKRHSNIDDNSTLYSYYKDIYDIIREKILIAYIIEYINNEVHFGYRFKIMHFDLNSVINVLFNAKDNQDVFVEMIEKNILPKYLVAKYQYLVDAKNFDIL